MSAAVTEAASPLRRARRARLRGLYAVTPDVADTTLLVVLVAAAIRGGAAAVQYRNKGALRQLPHEQALALAGTCRGRALFIVNDDPALAAAVGADGVHVGENDADLAEARAVVGPDALIGVSCYDDVAQARRAVAAGADYVAFGSFFPSSVKPEARRAKIELLRAQGAPGVPVVAIGGITAANAGTLIAAGADAVAVISDVFSSGEPGGVMRAARALAATCRDARQR
jgi:thiamine-phosphate pyrophosphorylase